MSSSSFSERPRKTSITPRWLRCSEGSASADRRTADASSSLSSPGHPPPAVVVDGGPPQLLAVTAAPPLGTGVAHQEAREHQDVLPAGAVLVAYTDGLIERRRDDITQGLALLTDALAAACAGADVADAIAQAVLDALVPNPDKAEDDVCLLVVRRLP